MYALLFGPYGLILIFPDIIYLSNLTSQIHLPTVNWGRYGTNHPQLKQYTHVSHVCDTHGVNHACMGLVNSKLVCTYLQYLQTIMLYVCACLYGYCSWLRSYLLFSLSYYTISVVTLFIPYRAWSAHQGMENKIAEEVESKSLIL